jgi:CheY-like chemotaxis protein
MKRYLLIESNPDLAKSVSDKLGPEGFEFESVATLDEACRKLSGHPVEDPGRVPCISSFEGAILDFNTPWGRRLAPARRPDALGFIEHLRMHRIPSIIMTVALPHVGRMRELTGGATLVVRKGPDFLADLSAALARPPLTTMGAAPAAKTGPPSGSGAGDTQRSYVEDFVAAMLRFVHQDKFGEPGGFPWCYREEVTVARFVDCTCRSIRDSSTEIVAGRRQMLAAELPEVAAAAIYDWLRDQRFIIYDFEPAAPGETYQYVRWHRAALKRGTCIDLACLYAAFLLEAHQRPVLIHYLDRRRLEAHMACGFWNTGSPEFKFVDPIICRNVYEFQEHVRSRRLSVVECMGFAKGDESQFQLNLAYDEAKKLAREDALRLKEFNFAVDIAACRSYPRGAIKPIPQDAG